MTVTLPSPSSPPRGAAAPASSDGWSGPRAEHPDESGTVVFGRLYEEHRAALYAFCLARTRDRALAEDIVQDAFTKAMVHWRRFDPARPFWPWVASIAARECLNARRSQSYAQARVDALSAALPESSGDPTESAVFDRMAFGRLDRAIRALPVRQQMALRLFAVDGWSYADIAAQLACSATTVKSLLARARARLRETGVRVGLGVAAGVRSALDRLVALTRQLGRSMFAWGDVLGVGSGPTSAPALALTVVLVGIAAVGGGGETRPPRAESPSLEWSTASTPPLTPGTPRMAGPPAAPATAPKGSLVIEEPALRAPAGNAQRLAADMASGLVGAPSGEARPEDVDGHAMAVSAEDETVYAAQVAPARIGSTPALFVSRDGGTSWTRARAAGFRGARRLLLPPAYPRDFRVFALTPVGLQVSRDGGDTFETVLAAWGLDNASLSPSFNSGDPRMLLVGRGQIIEYHDDTGLVEPLVVEHASDETVLDVAYAADRTDDNAMLVFIGRPFARSGAHLLGTAEVETGHVSRCRPPSSANAAGRVATVLSCERGEPITNFPTSLVELRTARFPAPGTVVLRAPQGLSVSEDGGRTFRPLLRWPEVRTVTDAAMVPTVTGHAFLAATFHGESGGPALLRSDDDGVSWRPVVIEAPGFQSGADRIVVSKQGHVIVSSISRGVACSADGGSTWSAACPRP